MSLLWLANAHLAVILRTEIKSGHLFSCLSTSNEVMGPDAMINLFSQMADFGQFFHIYFHQEAFKISSSFLYIRGSVICICEVIDNIPTKILISFL